MVLLLRVVLLRFLLRILVSGLHLAGVAGVLPVGRSQLSLRLAWLKLPWLGFLQGSGPMRALQIFAGFVFRIMCGARFRLFW
jgi:hypothetical protein